jgi:hypothetical protein
MNGLSAAATAPKEAPRVKGPIVWLDPKRTLGAVICQYLIFRVFSFGFGGAGIRFGQISQ